METLPGLENGVEVEITTEDPNNEETSVFFNRAAAASSAFNKKFPDVKDVSESSTEAAAARKWLSNGLEEAVLDFLAKAEKGDALHAAVYEFQKQELSKASRTRRNEALMSRSSIITAKRTTRTKPHDKNDAAIKTAGLDDETLAAEKLQPVVKPRNSNPQSAIMHNKFVVLLKKDKKNVVPKAVWSGSTNWTDGGIYGQLNVGHAVFDDEVAAAYEKYFQLLHDDADASTIKHALGNLTPISLLIPGEHKVMPVFSPQSSDTMLHLYSKLCEDAKLLMVSAPFALSPIILAALIKKSPDVLRFLLLDKIGSLGHEVNIIEGDPNDSIAVATTISSPLHDFQGALLEGKESFHHAGIHIHSKIIMVDPFGSDPIIVTGSANFSNNSTEVNDSNSMILRGFTAVADIYATEFMRMFEHYHFRAKEAKAQDKSKPLGIGRGRQLVGRILRAGKQRGKRPPDVCRNALNFLKGEKNMPSKICRSCFLFAVFSIFALSFNIFGWGEEGHRITVRIAAGYLTPAVREEAIRLLKTDIGNNNAYYRQTCPDILVLSKKKSLTGSDKITFVSGGLACIAAWADPPVKRQRGYTSNWHFVDVPVIRPNSSKLTLFKYDAARDCRMDTRSGDCAIQALERLQPVLADYKDSAATDGHQYGEELTTRAEALKFFVHIVGDIHQPLHCVTDKKDATSVNDPKDVGDMGGNLKYATWFGETNTPYGANESAFDLGRRIY